MKSTSFRGTPSNHDSYARLSSGIIWHDTSMERQSVHAFLPLDCVDANHWRLAGELNCRNNRVELGHIEIAFKLFARRPIFDEQ